MARKPSLRSLRMFMNVAHNRSFSETGRTAHVSQPALSRTIRLLEEDLGVRLFDRNSRNVSLTSAGEALLPIVERLTADFDHAFSELAMSFAGERGRVVVGALPSVAAGILPAAIATFRKVSPNVEIIIRDQLSGTLYQAMHERQIDLAVTTPPEGDDDFVFEALFEDPLVLVVRKGSPLDDESIADWSIFAQHPFIAMAPRSSVRQLTDSAMLRAGVAPQPLFDCAQLTTVRALIEAGLGITALPQSAATMLEPSKVSLRQLTNPMSARTIGIAYPAGRTLPPAAAAFARHFLEEAGPAR
ncbi:MAG TPA: LysR family transcriptional regulator [Novosphingobium sp.]|nr:LysR family transcriptional regulator [Novosphingobium sp. 17-62-19]HQS95514.1 LysR family transcriptional regulator [Novosphingobium sp.]